ncbi:hypothetical protein RMN64_15675 [Plesiomonas shigelloides]|uniref:hypothetical protein n=1 Tax=Plesiomonas shigelloides TaxID=703 RepID=UPI0028856DF5|nr:hypothetical protein [Plesiomonas shigelloides]MDT1012855.1 hypothetical protein [Plesiomonas shigelloides]
MAKYQFFSKPETGRKEFTYLDMDSKTFIKEKNQLLEMGYIVEDDIIYAETPTEAIDKFKLHLTTAIQEFVNSNVAGGFTTFLIESFKEIKSRLK